MWKTIVACLVALLLGCGACYKHFSLLGELAAVRGGNIALFEIIQYQELTISNKNATILFQDAAINILAEEVVILKNKLDEITRQQQLFKSLDYALE